MSILNILNFKILKILNKKERKNLVTIVLLLVVASSLETVGIGSVYPLVKVLLAEDIYSIHNYLNYFLYLFNNPSKNTFIIFYLISVTFFFVLKNAYLFLIINILNKFILNFQNRISQDLYETYINKEYQFFLTYETSRIVRNLTQEISRVSQSLLMAISLLGEALIFIFVSLFLFFLSPYIFFLLISTIVIMILVYYFIIKKKLVYWGSEISSSYNEFANNILQTFQNIKYVKLIDKNILFIKDFLEHYKNYTKKVTYSKIVSQTPKLFLETIFIIVFFIIFQIEYTKDNMTDLLAIIGVLTFAIIKLLPSFNKIITSYQYILLAQKPLANILHLIFDESKNELNLAEKTSKINFQSLQFKNINFSYGEEKFKIKDLSFKINKKEKLAIIGESGSGKSTILDLISFLLYPSSGEIILNSNQLLNEKNLQRNFRNSLSYVCQSTNIFNNTLIYNITLEKDFIKIDKEKYFKILRILDLENLGKSIIDLDSTKKLGELGSQLSGGQRQKIGIARALYKDSEILILDESTSSLDENSENKILKSIFSEYNDLTTIMVTHKKQLVTNFDKILLINRGKVDQFNEK